MYMIFSDTNVNGRQIGEIRHCNVPKKFELASEIGFPVSETQF